MTDTKTHLPLAKNQIHLWQFNLETVSIDWQTANRHYLSADENERAAKFKRGGEDYINTRIFMRQVLAQYTHQEPHQLIFDRNPYGKPFLRHSNIQFNLSHSRQWALLAVGIDCDLGVDVESTSDRRSILNIAQHYFHPDEIADLDKITDEETQKNYFFRLWTLKESFVKALGTGLSTGLDKMRFAIDSHHQITASFSPELQITTPQHWQFFQHELKEASVDNWCAVAVRSQNKIQLTWM